ncbi:hypothetical protein PDR5_16490 [Pseudomonas sp. DR 5-09]|jgi:hypothetical protein|nr:hypothetical protein PDR5_16490 [Pseudomonas sp. DR 5-09]
MKCGEGIVLKSLKLSHVGPLPQLDVQFSSRLNLITGDNGLGKSFLLDIAWWALTRKWPGDLNRALTGAGMVRPTDPAKASIEFSVSAKTKDVSYATTFSPLDQAWTGKAGRPINPGLVLYAMADGSFAAWDPARNYWLKKGNLDVQDRVPGYVFSAREIWDGLVDSERGLLCNGLIADWASWYKEKGESYEHLCAALAKLSPEEGESLELGPLTRISLDDPRDIPTLRMPYGQDVPVVHASSGMKRVLAIAYLLVWSWQEHVKASALLGQDTTPRLTFLIDEVESHLHPRWQRSVVGALLDVVTALSPTAQVQILLVTHSPLVMASVEPRFDKSQDAWFDLDLETNSKSGETEVHFRQREFVRLGEVSRWLMSDAFDLGSARSIEAEKTLEEASRILSQEVIDEKLALSLDARLRKLLGDTDPFWIRWRYVGEKQGWLK